MNQNQAPAKIRPAFDTLREIRSGECMDELAAEINTLTEAVERTRRGGKVTLTINIKPADGSEVAVVVADDIKTTIPQMKKRTTIMFTTDEHNIQVENPRQRDLGLKVAENPEAAKVPRAVSA